MSWKTNKGTGKKFQSKGRGIDSGTFKNLRSQDGHRSPAISKTYLEKLKKAVKDTEFADYELYDIFQSVTPQNVKDVAESNVEYILKREKLLPKGYRIVIPEGGYDYKLEDDSDGLGYMNGSFEIFAPDMNTIVAYGRFNSTISAEEMLDMDLGITKVNI